MDMAPPGGSAAFALRPKGARGKAGAATDKGKAFVRKGMALLDPALAPTAHWEFKAEVLVLHHQTTLCLGYAPVVHVGAIVQAATVTAMHAMREGAPPVEALRTGDRAVLSFRFMHRPAYLRAGDALLFREGRAKGVGMVLELAAPHHARAADA